MVSYVGVWRHCTVYSVLPVLLASSADSVGFASSVVSANHHAWACIVVPAKWCNAFIVCACTNSALCPRPTCNTQTVSKPRHTQMTSLPGPIEDCCLQALQLKRRHMLWPAAGTHPTFKSRAPIYRLFARTRLQVHRRAAFCRLLGPIALCSRFYIHEYKLIETQR